MEANKKITWGVLAGASALLFVNIGIFIGVTHPKTVYISSTAEAATPQSATTQTTASTQSTGVVPQALQAFHAEAIPQSEWSQYEHLPVTTADGKTEYLDAMKHPIMWSAYWCEHCQHTLKAFEADHLAVTPDLIVVQNSETDTLSLADTKVNVQQEFQSLHLNPSAFDVSYEGNFSLLSQLDSIGYPDTVFAYDGKLYSIPGELSDPTQWETLFSTQNLGHILGA